MHTARAQKCMKTLCLLSLCRINAATQPDSGFCGHFLMTQEEIKGYSAVMRAELTNSHLSGKHGAVVSGRSGDVR